MSHSRLFPIFILAFAVLFGCVFQSVNGRPQDSKTTTQSSTVENVTKQPEASAKIEIKEVITSNSTETSTKTTTTTKPPKLTTVATTKAPKVSSERTTVKTTTTTKQTTTSKPKSSTQGTTKPTDSPKIPVVLPKTPLKAERPESGPSKTSTDVIVNKTDDQGGAHNENVKSFLPERQPDLGAGIGDLSDDDETENPTFRLKEPGFGTPKPRPAVTTPASTDEDKRIRQTWGGNCLAEHWQRCSNIKTWADFYVVYEKSDKEKLHPIKRNKKYDCWGKDENTYCLRNGWTVNRCHINCMAHCNRDMFQKWELYVSHDGACPLWK
jgi:hypothetical protein